MCPRQGIMRLIAYYIQLDTKSIDSFIEKCKNKIII